MIVTYGLDKKPHRGESRPRIALIKTYLLTYLDLENYVICQLLLP